MAQFATVEEFNTLLGVAYELNDARITRLIEMASSLVQAEARQRLELVTDDAVTLWSGEAGTLDLPERPVVDMTSVVVSPFGAPPYAVVLTALTRHGYEVSGGPWSIDTALLVTYSHGYAVIPDDIRQVCCTIVGRMLFNPTQDESKSLGDYNVAHSSSGSVFSDADRKVIRDRYRPKVFSTRTNSAQRGDRGWPYA